MSRNSPMFALLLVAACSSPPDMADTAGQNQAPAKGGRGNAFQAARSESSGDAGDGGDAESACALPPQVECFSEDLTDSGTSFVFNMVQACGQWCGGAITQSGDGWVKCVGCDYAPVVSCTDGNQNTWTVRYNQDKTVTVAGPENGTFRCGP